MLVLQAYTVYDSKVGSYGRPFFAESDGVALRMVVDVARDRNTLFASHPEDFALYGCGSFEQESGNLSGDPLRHVCNFDSVLGEKEQV